MNVLVNLYRGYGLGDGVQTSVILHHLAKYRPDWCIDYQVEEGRQAVARKYVANTFTYGQPYPCSHYDLELPIVLFNARANWDDRPNTHVVTFLREKLDIDWDATCGRYNVEVSSDALGKTEILTRSSWWSHRKGMVGIHYQGVSAPEKKNLTHEQATRICNQVEKLGYVPILIDWFDSSPIPDREHVRTTGRLPFSREWGASAEMNCALISQCSAFVGIDSGPAKCASATNTPALVVWTGHHPMVYHDPAPNTIHLVPIGYAGLEPICTNQRALNWFERHYRVRQYSCDLVVEVGNWLKGVLDNGQSDEKIG